MAQIKLNLSSGRYLSVRDPDFIRPGTPGNECGARLPVYPFYCCTMDKGHHNRDGDESDHVAHGYAIADLTHNGQGKARRILAMFAKWSD